MLLRRCPRACELPEQNLHSNSYHRVVETFCSLLSGLGRSRRQPFHSFQVITKRQNTISRQNCPGARPGATRDPCPGVGITLSNLWILVSHLRTFPKIAYPVAAHTNGFVTSSQPIFDSEFSLTSAIHWGEVPRLVHGGQPRGSRFTISPYLYLGHLTNPPLHSKSLYSPQLNLSLIDEWGSPRTRKHPRWHRGVWNIG